MPGSIPCVRCGRRRVCHLDGSTGRLATQSKGEIQRYISDPYPKRFERDGTGKAECRDELPCAAIVAVKGYYELQYRDRGAAGWKIGHRYQAGFIVSGTKQNIKLGWRELLQHTFIGGTNEVQLRSRLRLAYEPGSWIAYPYFSVEAFQPVGDKAFFSLPRVRYRPGVRWPFSRKTALDVYYCRQYDVKRCLNILGLNLEIKL